MPTSNDFKQKTDKKSNFASSFLRRAVTAALCFGVIASANAVGGERVKAYTSAFGRALRNNTFGIDSIGSLKAEVERLYRMIPSDGRVKEDAPPQQGDNNIGNTDNSMNGIECQ